MSRTNPQTLDLEMDESQSSIIFKAMKIAAEISATIVTAEVKANSKIILDTLKEAHETNHKFTHEAVVSLRKVSNRGKQCAKEEMKWNAIVHKEEEVHGPSHEFTLDAMRSLAKVYENAGEYTKAKTHWENIVKVTKAEHGPNHGNTLSAMRGLAKMHENAAANANEEEKWMDILRACVPNYQARLGPMVSILLPCMIRDKLRSAEKEWEKTVKVTQIHGSCHEDTLEAMKDLAHFYERFELYPQAEAQWRDIVNLTTHAPGDGNMLNAMEKLAEIYKLSKHGQHD